MAQDDPRLNWREVAYRGLPRNLVDPDIVRLRRAELWLEALADHAGKDHGHAAGRAGCRSATRTWNGHSTAPFAAECQSFLDNV